MALDTDRRIVGHPRARYARDAARLGWLCALAVTLAAAALASLLAGPVALPAADIVGAIAHPTSGGFAHAIAWDIRLPRILIGACVGTGLGVAGAMLQALFRNPLVDPYLTGVAAGAALAASLGFAVGASFVSIPLVAFAGGLTCALLVAFVGAGGAGGIGGTGNLRLVLAGVAVSALCSALVTLVLLRRGSSDAMSILSWLAGSLSGRGWNDLVWSAAYLVAGLMAGLFLLRALNVLRLGTVAAAGLGLNVGVARLEVLGVAALITAACVSVSGIVGFVGLMVPHGVRRLVGGDMRWLLPGSALGGALVVVAADTFARTLMPPTEIPLGVLLALVGVPFFVAIARKPVEL